MIWEEEAFEFDKEKHMKKYIKGELMSYYLSRRAVQQRWYPTSSSHERKCHRYGAGAIVSTYGKNQKLDGLLN